MSKFPIVFIVILLLSSLIVVAGVALNPAEDDGSEGNFYKFSLSVADETYVVTVRSNYTATPEVSYSALMKSVSVDFKGDPEDAFCNITIPADLIWGEFSVIDKYYEMDAACYTESSNGTHNSVYFTFDYTAYAKHFEVMATNGITELDGNLYTLPLSVANNTYVVTVRSNYTSAPEIDYYELGDEKIVSVDFMGDPETAFCNITVPNNLLWGELSLISKYYEMPASYYTETSNSTHSSIYFVFDQISLIKHFEIKATEGASASVGKLYTFPLSVANNTYVVTVWTNWTYAPEVEYSGLFKGVYMYFKGCFTGTVDFNITIPNDLIWGELFVYKKSFKQSKDYYTLSSNSTHNSIQYTFSKIAAVEVVSIKGTEGVMQVP